MKTYRRKQIMLQWRGFRWFHHNKKQVASWFVVDMRVSTSIGGQVFVTVFVK